jgi:hypothetical protein
LKLVVLLYPLLGHLARFSFGCLWARSLSAGCSCDFSSRTVFLHGTTPPEPRDNRPAFKGTFSIFQSFLGIPDSGEFAMQEVVDKVMQTYGMMKTLSGEELEEAREVLLDFLSKRPGTDEHTATVESLTFLRNLKT